MLGLFRKQNIAKTIAPLLLVVGLCFTLATTQSVTVSAAPGDDVAPSQEETGIDHNSEEEVTCAIEKLGWVLCPVIEQAGDIGDKAFSLLASNFLETEPELVAATTGGRPSGTYVAWEMARNIANVMFIIAFLIIIYSQVTGAGLNNYGIKKLLPRLIIAVIAVNASYYICQAMVDLTNILGYTIKDFLVQTASTISDKSAMPVAAAELSISQTSPEGGVLKGIALGVLGLGAIVWLILPMLGVSVAAILIACLAIIVILMMRKAFIVLLVVLSPIAFVLYLLPNTERYFKKWANMFWQLLMVFPVVALLFGGGQIASGIVLIAGTQTTSSTTAVGDSNSVYRDGSGKCIQLPSSTTGPGGNGGARVANCGTGSTPFMLGLTAALIAVAPLFAVWAVLKGALSAAGAIGGKVGGTIQTIGDKAGRGGQKGEDWAKKAAGKAMTTAAYGNKYGRPVVGAGRRFKRRGELADAKLAAAQAAYDADGGVDLSNKIAAAQAASSVAKSASNEAFTDAFADNGKIVGQYLGNPGAETALGKALESQQTDYKQKAQKEIEARLDPTKLKELGEALSKAILNGHTLEARAISSALLNSGGAGQKQFYSGMRGAASGTAAPGVNTAEVTKELQRNILSNHGSMKSQDYAIGKWAEDTSASLSSLATKQGSAGTYAGMTASQFASQSKESQTTIYNTISPQAQAGLVSQLKASPNSIASIDNGVRARMGL